MQQENLELIRGNSKDISFTVEIDNVLYEPLSADRIYFTVKNMKYDPNTALIKKNYPETIDFIEEDKLFIIHFFPEDTENLCPGIYEFDLEFVFQGVTSKIKTAVKGNLEIINTVTRKGDRI